MRPRLAPLIVAALFVAPMLGHAGSDKDFGDYIVHCNAISTQQLSPAIAKQYGIDRSKNRGLLNISVESTAGTVHTVSADVTVTVGDLTGHDKPINVRETSENGDIDYLAEFPIDNSGTFVFTVKATPADRRQPFVMKCTQDLVVD